MWVGLWWWYELRRSACPRKKHVAALIMTLLPFLLSLLPSFIPPSSTTHTDSHARPTHPAQALSSWRSAAGSGGREGHPGCCFSLLPISHLLLIVVSARRARLLLGCCTYTYPAHLHARLLPEPTHSIGVEPRPRHRRGVLRLAQPPACLPPTLPFPRWVCSHAGT